MAAVTRALARSFSLGPLADIRVRFVTLRDDLRTYTEADIHAALVNSPRLAFFCFRNWGYCGHGAVSASNARIAGS
jgi:hypothetical protein